MNKILKTLSLFASVFAVVGFLGGCSSSGDAKHHRDERIVRTHQDDDITRIGARMYQKHGDKGEMGSIKFTEKDSGLEMDLDLKDMRPGMEYKLYVHNAKGEESDIKLPNVRADANGKVKRTYMITGVSAAELDNMKIVLKRVNSDGTEPHVGWGKIKERGWFM
jgi:hypothetical protein